ncbi:hypothetical protein CCAND93_530019 [Capnocytophaga canis]|uniref:Uncharacterized protein n=1 Tax=Capnocytophaga canis TaxID=1848903 RepID=A0A0B7IUI1_9FLAO|nr:hypothetical protein CCAND93_530019 [Capnocytophaga canis]
MVSPGENAKLSTPKVSKLWQELQLMFPSFDKRVSKYSFLPKAIFSSEISGLGTELTDLKNVSAVFNNSDFVSSGCTSLTACFLGALLQLTSTPSDNKK